MSKARQIVDRLVEARRKPKPAKPASTADKLKRIARNTALAMVSTDEGPIAKVDPDNAYVVSGKDSTVYFDVGQGFDDKWYVSIITDSTGYSGDLLADDGPYDSEQEAIQGGKNAAVQWFVNNGLEYDMDQRLAVQEE